LARLAGLVVDQARGLEAMAQERHARRQVEASQRRAGEALARLNALLDEWLLPELSALAGEIERLSQGADALAALRRRAGALGSLVRAMRAPALEQGKSSPLSTVRPEEVARRAAEGAVGHGGVQLTISSAMPPVCADPAWLEMLFAMLFTRAAASGVAAVEIDAEQVGTRVLINVRPAGPGTPVGTRERPLPPGFAHAEEDGSTVWADLARRLVEAMDGDFGHECTADETRRCWFWLRAAQAPADSR
jgi:light-regulated signal transduction histidine kinase (bacteriophytochrome)